MRPSPVIPRPADGGREEDLRAATRHRQDKERPSSGYSVLGLRSDDVVPIYVGDTRPADVFAGFGEGPRIGRGRRRRPVHALLLARRWAEVAPSS